MKKLFLIAVIVFVTAGVFAQSKPITTFILVRHAEKDLTQSTNDPDLSAQGMLRASKLVDMFKLISIDAIYSTDFKRTRQTVDPLAAARSLPVVIYNPTMKEDVDVMLRKHEGATVVVVGHSNTVPQFVNYLVGEEKYRPMGDGEYGNLIIVSVTERGNNAKVTWINY